MPKGVRWVVLTWPLPLQSGQTSAVVPAAQPEPAPEVPKKDPYEVMLDSFNSTLGINKEKKG